MSFTMGPPRLSPGCQRVYSGLDGFIPAWSRLPLRDAVDRDEALVLVVGEDLAAEIVAPDFVTAVDHGARRLLVLRLKFWVMT
ncbi:MAG: hypothetical protein IPN03_05890 [Holophagales bacterium]|nr:hypothetical protein [Holophagales bacterium]